MDRASAAMCKAVVLEKALGGTGMELLNMAGWWCNVPMVNSDE
jgi:hypothetical protein